MLRVATWNVLHPAYAVPERYREIDPRVLEPRRRAAAVRDRVTQLLSSYDVVALQEVDTTTARALVGEGTALLTAARPHAPDGVLLASRRHPLLRARTGTSADGRRVWCSAEVEDVTIVCTHLDWSDAGEDTQHRGLVQLDEIVAWIGPDLEATQVVVGDLNDASDGRVGSALAAAGFAHLAGGASTAAIGGTAVSLDTVAVRGGGGTAYALGALPPPGSPYLLPDASVPSDHVPLVAEIT
jgi:endonuclease/exonuclease/phosphatase family metal-dependent hydrolase